MTDERVLVIGRSRERYTDKVVAIGLEAARQGRRGEVIHVNVAHDDWCGVFRGLRCACEPEVTAR